MSRQQVTREEAFGLLLEQKAAEEKNVGVFRERFLKGKLLSGDKVEPWIKRLERIDGPPTVWLDVPLPPGYNFQRDHKTGRVFTKPRLTIPRQNGGRSLHLRTLAYGVPEDCWERHVPTTNAGVLERLRQISVFLAKRYGWQEAQATLFVLTGRIPLVSPVRCKVNLSRITLDVDPSITPRHLADHYRRIRRKVLAKRTRSLSPKHINLAAFLAGRDPGKKWEERLNAWNERYPCWKYDDVGIFSRDCRQAKKRLLAQAISFEKVLISP